MKEQFDNLAKFASIKPLSVAEQSNIKGAGMACEEKRPRVRR